MKIVVALLACLMLVGATGCSSSNPQLKPGGTVAKIRLDDKRIVRGELLALQQGLLVVDADSIYQFPEEKVKSVELELESSSTWRVLMILASIPATALTIDALTSDYPSTDIEFPLAWLLIDAVAYASFELTEPKSTYRMPLDHDDRMDLLLHMRFPYGVPPDQLARLVPGRERYWDDTWK